MPSRLLPGFTAHSSLSRTSDNGLVLPALGERDNPYPKETCLSNCLEDCMGAGESRATCSTRCQRRCSGGSEIGVAGPTPGSGGLAIYGNYCGPGHGDPTGATPPVDAVDAACRTHDLCYDATNYFNCGCDRALLYALPGAIASTPSTAGKAAGAAVAAYFAGSPCVCASWACIFTPHACVGIGGHGAIC
jgi:Phospholipase A2-like domain